MKMEYPVEVSLRLSTSDRDSLIAALMARDKSLVFEIVAEAMYERRSIVSDITWRSDLLISDEQASELIEYGKRVWASSLLEDIY